ncbi:hypothetical protein DUI87_00089 [Hirundo rustica rustica]|uniref:Zinc finger and BTB domain containing 4 n=1 Tax=Hirundo rustica rustica TaxID=333673 RepID=A0A3M0LCA0_HIRRU|nr:hypothetical protein DUI87_00089 [Hirundo rustica rustica]
MAPVVEVSDAGHCRALLLELNEQRLRGQFCDVTIIAEDTKFRAHKNVLAASSPFFKRALAQEPACPRPRRCWSCRASRPASSPTSSTSSTTRAWPCRRRRPRGRWGPWPAPGHPLAAGAGGRAPAAGHERHLDPPSAGGAAGNPALPAAPVDLTFPARPGETAAAAGGETAPTGGDAVTASPSPVSPASPSAAALRCGLCGRGFGSAAALGFHAKLHRGRRGLCCRHCGKSFIHVKRLQTHEVGCRDGGGETPPPPPVATAAAAAGSHDPRLLLDRGGAESGQEALLLLRHRALEPGAEQEPLVKVVDGQVLYLCGVCQRSYMTLSSLKRHANVHSWRRKYPCRYCDKVFALAEYRTKHEVWHTGERRYQCNLLLGHLRHLLQPQDAPKSLPRHQPGLIASEKTPNGGYRPKLNALKLYRLLPMRAHKRPYKTYSQGNGARRRPAAAGRAGRRRRRRLPPGAAAGARLVIAYVRAAPSVIVRARRRRRRRQRRRLGHRLQRPIRAGEEPPGLPEAPAARAGDAGGAHQEAGNVHVRGSPLCKDPRARIIVV